MPTICEKHKLALADDGQCVLCRRTFSQRVRQRMERHARPPTLGDQILTALLGLGVLAALTGTYLASKQHGVATVARTLDQPPSAAATTSTTSAATTTTRQSALDATGDAVATAATPEPPGALGVPAAPYLTGGSVPAPVNRDALAAARAQVALTLYATPWCFVCDWARADLNRRNLGYRELDIERDRSALARLTQLNPMASVPTFEIDGEALVGYGTWQLNDAIDRAALRRMRASTTPAQNTALQTAQMAEPTAR